MTDIYSEMSDKELDNLAATKIMGWIENPNGVEYIWAPASYDNGNNLLTILSRMEYAGFGYSIRGNMGGNGSQWKYEVFYCREEWVTSDLAQSRVLPYAREKQLGRAIVIAACRVL